MRYYSTQRPVAPGSFPIVKGNPMISAYNYDDKTYIPGIDKEAWGYIEYMYPLSEKDVTDYELVPEGYHGQMD